MRDIMTMPIDELKTDLDETMNDIGWCVMAEVQGIETYSNGKSVSFRLNANKKIAAVILKELERRDSES